MPRLLKNHHSASKVSLECICYAEAPTDTAALALLHVLLENSPNIILNAALHSPLDTCTLESFIRKQQTPSEVSFERICHAEASTDTAALALLHVLEKNPKLNPKAALRSPIIICALETFNKNEITVCEVSFERICYAEAPTDTAALAIPNVLPENLVKNDLSIALHSLPYICTLDTFIWNQLTLSMVSFECICRAEANLDTALAIHSSFAEPHFIKTSDDQNLQQLLQPSSHQHIDRAPQVVQVREDKQCVTRKMTDLVNDSETKMSVTSVTILDSRGIETTIKTNSRVE